MTAWTDLESFMLSGLSQAVKDKYHMISPLSGTELAKQTSKQNITRGIEIKNRLMGNRWETTFIVFAVEESALICQREPHASRV